MSLTLIIQPADGEVLRTRLQPGRNRISVRVGDSYRLVDDATGKSPPGMVVRQVDSSLWIDGLDPAMADPPVVELAGFYTLCSAGSPCQLLIESSTSQPAAVITPGTPAIGALADGTFVLHDPGYTPPAPPPVDSGLTMRYGLYGLGGLAVLGLAAGGGGGGGSGDGDVSGGGEPVPDGSLKLVTTAYNQPRPLFAGEGEPGSKVTVRLDVNGDGIVDVTYAAIVGDDFRWQVDLATARPESGTMPPAGLGNNGAVIAISASTTQGLVNLTPMIVPFDDVPPAAPILNPVSGDGQVNGPERAAGVTVSGSAEGGATVTVDWAGQVRTAVANADGQWQVRFNAASLPADGNSRIEVIARDPAGNTSQATTATVLIDTRVPDLSVSAIAGPDGVLTLADGDSFRFTGRTDAGSQVRVRWNEVERSVTAADDGQWAIAYGGAELPLLDAVPVAYTIEATNLAGNTAATAGSLLVDRVAPPAPAIDPVTGDNRISVNERAAGITVTGNSAADTAVEVQWGTTVRHVTADAAGIWHAGFTAGELPAVVSPGSNSTLTARATDAAGNTGASQSVSVYIEQPFAPPVINPVASDNIVNAAERGAGVLVTGSVTAGSPGVEVSWGSFSGTAVVSGSSWQIRIPAGAVPGDGPSQIVAAIAGYPSATTTRAVTVDTTAPSAPAIAAVTGDNIILPGERVGGVQVNGTAEAGAAMRVSWGSAAQTTTADTAGHWSVTFQPGQLPGGTAGVVTSQISAVATDTAGNTSVAGQQTVQLVVPYAPPAIAPVTGDDVINGGERTGVIIQGTVAAGAPGVRVDLGDYSGVAAVSGNSWSLALPAAAIPSDGEWQVVATVNGPAGGASSTRNVTVDTTAPTAPLVDLVTGDDKISLTENVTGFRITGQSEAGAEVHVTLGSVQAVATANASGNWTTGNIVLTAAPGNLTLTAIATDKAGNTSQSTTRTITVEGPDVAIGHLLSDDPFPGIFG